MVGDYLPGNQSVQVNLIVFCSIKKEINRKARGAFNKTHLRNDMIDSLFYKARWGKIQAHMQTPIFGHIKFKCSGMR